MWPARAARTADLPLVRQGAGVCRSTHTHNTFGGRRYSAVGTRLWNSLPPALTISHRRTAQAFANSTFI